MNKPRRRYGWPPVRSSFKIGQYVWWEYEGQIFTGTVLGDERDGTFLGLEEPVHKIHSDYMQNWAWLETSKMRSKT
jgi:hypothetical protein